MRFEQHMPAVRRSTARFGALGWFAFAPACAAAQGITALVDSLRLANAIPAIGFAVVSATTIRELRVLGVRQAGTDRVATIDDRFRIGSITKTVTSLIAARLVRAHLIRWDARLFDLLPQLKTGSNAAYQSLTLRDLLSFRERLIPWTYTDPVPAPSLFTGDADTQRLSFLRWALQQPPVRRGNGVHFSNVAYVAAGAMLERASGKRYAQLVKDLGDTLHIDFRFGAPNSRDSLAMWGHHADGSPEPPGDDIRLEWLQSAGNLTLSLPQLAAYAQVHLQGLAGQSSLLDRTAFIAMHTGRPEWAVGWKWTTDPDGEVRSYHTGNPGAFLSMLYVHHRNGLAYILFANRQSEASQQSLNLIYDALRAAYDSSGASRHE